METTRRKLLTLLSSIPALGLLGIGGTKAEAKKYTELKDHPGLYVPVLDTDGNPSPSGFYVKAPFPSNDLYDTMGKPLSAWEKIERNIRATDPMQTQEEFKVTLALNKKIVKEHPSLFPTERIMTSPTCKMINGEECVAESRYMKAEYTLEFAQELKGICGLDAEEELKNLLADEMAIELLHLDDKLMDMGYGMCPYIPAQIVKAIDSDTFQPKIRILTMYGVAKV